MSEGRNTAIAAWWKALLVGFCLLPGCPDRKPAVDLYVDAVALRELGQDKLAVEKLNAAVAADPGLTLAYVELGKAHRTLENHEKALAAFRQAAKLDPWSLENHLELARTSEKLEKYPQAAAAYARAAELDPDNLEALMGAAGCYLKAGQLVRAQTYGERAEQMGEKPREVLPLLARIHEGQEDYEQAIQVYGQLLALDGNDPNVLLPLGVAYMKAEQYDRAGQVLVSVTQMRPEDSAAFRHLGYCSVKLGDTDRAIQMYQRAIDLNNRDWEAHRGLGVAYMLKARQTGDARWKVTAVRHWRQSLAIEPDQPKRQTLEKLIREHSKPQDSLQGSSY